MSDDRMVLMAEIGAAHGIRGEVRLRVHASDPASLAQYGPLVADDGRAFVVRRLKPAGTVFVAAIDGVSDRNAAEALNGVRLYLDRNRLPPPDEDEFYHADLIGLRAVTTEGAVLGTVVAIHDFGAGDILDVSREGGRSVMVPFTREIVPEVAPARGEIVIDPPPGLLDTDSEGSKDGGAPDDRNAD